MLLFFIGRDEEEYYQVTSTEKIECLVSKREASNNSTPTIWALDSSRGIFTVLSDACIKVLKGQLDIKDIYPIFGTELLRHSRPLRMLLDVDYVSSFAGSGRKHLNIRNEVQDWLIYHDGIRRRSLILIDLLWAEAARLEDLPPSDLKSAAEAKIKHGKSSRNRLLKECLRLNGINHLPSGIMLSRFLRHSEYRKTFCRTGIRKSRLEKLNKEWTHRLLRNYR